MTRTVEAKAPAEIVLWAPQWAPWVLALLLMALHDALDWLYTAAMFASLGLGVCAAAMCLRLGVKYDSRARVYWFLVGLLTLALATLLLVSVLGFFWSILVAALLVLLVSSRSAQQPPGVHWHLVSAFLLWFLSSLVVVASHGRNGILLVVPPLWIIWTTGVAYRTLRAGTVGVAYCDPGR